MSLIKLDTERIRRVAAEESYPIRKFHGEGGAHRRGGEFKKSPKIRRSLDLHSVSERSVSMFCGVSVWTMNRLGRSDNDKGSSRGPASWR